MLASRLFVVVCSLFFLLFVVVCVGSLLVVRGLVDWCLLDW